MSNETVSSANYCHSNLSIIKKAKNKYRKFKERLQRNEVAISLTDVTNTFDSTELKGKCYPLRWFFSQSKKRVQVGLVYKGVFHMRGIKL